MNNNYNDEYGRYYNAKVISVIGNYSTVLHNNILHQCYFATGEKIRRIEQETEPLGEREIERERKREFWANSSTQSDPKLSLFSL